MKLPVAPVNLIPDSTPLQASSTSDHEAFSTSEGLAVDQATVRTTKGLQPALCTTEFLLVSRDCGIHPLCPLHL